MGSTSGNRPENDEGVRPASHGIGQRRVHRIVRQILAARKKADKSTPFAGDLVAHSAAQRRVTLFQRIEDSPTCYRAR
jgi:hypothetical protein